MNRKILLFLVLFFLLIASGQAPAHEGIKSAERLFSTGEYKKAINILKKIIEENPSDSYAWVLLGNSYLGLEKNKPAVEAFENAIQIDSKNEWAFLGLGRACTALHKYSAAIEAYKNTIEINPKNPDAHYELGVVYNRTVSLSYAFEQYKILKTLDNRLAEKLYHIILGN
jgi:cytochrome c-type biogenesis protein CcmH/NrfG